MKDDDFKLLRGFDNRRTDEQTFVIVESLSRLKNGVFTTFRGRGQDFFFSNESFPY